MNILSLLDFLGGRGGGGCEEEEEEEGGLNTRSNCSTHFNSAASSNVGSISEREREERSVCVGGEGREGRGRRGRGRISNCRHHHSNDTGLVVVVLTYHNAGRIEHRHFLHLSVRVPAAQENKWLGT